MIVIATTQIHLQWFMFEGCPRSSLNQISSMLYNTLAQSGESAVLKFHIRLNFNGLNTDGSFTTAFSNLLLSP